MISCINLLQRENCLAKLEHSQAELAATKVHLFRAESELKMADSQKTQLEHNLSETKVSKIWPYGLL